MTQRKLEFEKSKRGPKPTPLDRPMSEIRALFDRYVAGETYEALGKEIGKSSGQIQRMFIKAGLHDEMKTKEHWINLMLQKEHLYDRARANAHVPKITQAEFDRLGPKLRGLIIEGILKRGEKAHRAKLNRQGDKNIKKKMEVWKMEHGEKWARNQLPK